MKWKNRIERGFYSIGIFHPKHAVNQGVLWRSAYCFGANFIYTVGPRFKKQASDTVSAYRQIPMFNYEDVEDLKRHLPYGCRLIGIELTEKAENLKNFCHPEQCCYILGAEDHGLPEKVLEECHYVVQIPNLNNCLNVGIVGSCVLYDRNFKQKG